MAGGSGSSSVAPVTTARSSSAGMPASSACAAAHSVARRQVLAHAPLGVAVEAAEDVGADVLVDVRHARTPISSKTSRSERSAYHVRLLTVPSGSPSRSAISRTAQPLDVGEADHLTMLGRELVERAGDLPAEHRALDREPFGVLLVARLVQRERGAHRGAPARVDDRVPRDLVEPGPHAAARRVVGLGVPPGAREDLLHDLLGRPPVAERVQREAVELAGVGACRAHAAPRRWRPTRCGRAAVRHRWASNRVVIRAGPLRWFDTGFDHGGTGPTSPEAPPFSRSRLSPSPSPSPAAVSAQGDGTGRCAHPCPRRHRRRRRAT